MVSVKYVLAVCLFGIAFAQDEVGSGTDVEETIVPRGRSCYVGEGESYESIEGQTKVCKFLEQVCQAKVEIGKDGIRVYGECKERAACERNAESSNSCFSPLFTKAQSAEMEHVCHYCCEGSLCNSGAFVSAQVSASQDKLLFK